MPAECKEFEPLKDVPMPSVQYLLPKPLRHPDDANSDRNRLSRKWDI